jgi:phage baseplate assembly protein gpV
MSDSAQMQEVLDRLRNRFFGKYRGTVVDVDATTMCVKAEVPAVLGTQASGWCQPCVPYAGPQVGFLMLPAVGSGVWIEFEAGDVSHPIWVGCYWRTGELPGAASATVQSVVTTAGSLAFDSDASSITLQGSASQTVVLDSDGLTLKAGSGQIAIGVSGVNVNSGALVII